MAFDNRCGFRSDGHYALVADTLFFLVRYKPRDAAPCPGGQWFQAFAASTDTLQSGRYAIRIVVEQRGNQQARVYQGQVEIQPLLFRRVGLQPPIVSRIRYSRRSGRTS